jgi:hypothetical protein
MFTLGTGLVELLSPLNPEAVRIAADQDTRVGKVKHRHRPVARPLSGTQLPGVEAPGYRSGSSLEHRSLAVAARKLLSRDRKPSGK